MTRFLKKSGSTRGGRAAMIGSLIFHSALVVALWRVAALEAGVEKGPARFISDVVTTQPLPPAPPAPPESRPAPPEELPPERLVEDLEPVETADPFEPDFVPAPPPALALALPTRPYVAARIRPEPEPAPVLTPPPPAETATYVAPRGPSRPAAAAAGNPAPRYPSRAAARGIQGVVLLVVRLSESGEILKLEVLEGSGHSILDREALRAVATWRFHPKLEDGIAMPATIEVPIRFEVR